MTFTWKTKVLYIDKYNMQEMDKYNIQQMEDIVKIWILYIGTTWKTRWYTYGSVWFLASDDLLTARTP